MNAKQAKEFIDLSYWIGTAHGLALGLAAGAALVWVVLS